MDILMLEESNCVNCYKCIRECPVKSISFDNNQANVISDDCILCGKCVNACPQNARKIRCDVDQVLEYLAGDELVIASVAPSFPSFSNQVFDELYHIGFDKILETSEGASYVTREYERIANEQKKPNIITTSCPSTVSLVEKYYPLLVEQLAEVVSPMCAHGRIIRERYGKDVKIVFIGPCIAKKKEADEDLNGIDVAITFEEYDLLMEKAAKVRTGTYQKETNERALLYPTAGGILNSMNSKNDHYKYIAVDGVENCKNMLASILNDGVKGYFIEMSVCENSCINGPCINNNEQGILKKYDHLLKYISKEEMKKTKTITEVDLVTEYIAKNRHQEIPGEDKIKEILLLTGKDCKEKELNCQACGYNSCREKAIAVYYGKADYRMCLPYMRERAESISNEIIKYTPNAIIALNEQLEIQEINPSALEIFTIKRENAIGKVIGELIEESMFYDVLYSEQNVFNKKIELKKYGKALEVSIIYVKAHRLILTIIKDVTSLYYQHAQLNAVREDTVTIATEVINKQMRVAQEIASLLGETTAETKMALTKLKEIILKQEV